MIRATRRNVLLLSLSSGILWTLAWPATYTGFTLLAFVAFVPMLWAERLHDARTAARPRAFAPYAMAGLLLWNAATTWWLGAVSEPWGTRIFTGAGPTIGNTLLMALPWVLKRSVWRRLREGASLWGLLFFWLAFERLHMDWDLTWPWLTLGNVFAEHPAWVQWYEITGQLGGSLWVLAVNIAVFRVLVAWHSGSAFVQRLAVMAALFVLPLIASLVRYARYEPAGEPMEVVIVQPNVDPYLEKFGGIDPLEQLDGMLDQAESAMTPSTELVILPETALQENATVERAPDGRLLLHGLWENDLAASRSVRRILDFLREHPRCAVLSGMSSAYLYGPGEQLPVAARPLGNSDRWFEAYNAAVLVDGQGTVQPYHKSKLVAFVELMPFERWLGPLLDGASVDLGGTTGSLGAQEEREVMASADGRVKAAPIICYESVFGEHVARHVRNGATLLAIMTNDGWWDDAPGYRQHLQYGRLRAVETRRDIARSTNTGISCFVDQRGDIHRAAPWWEPAVIRGTVLLNDRLTFFVRHGDLIGRAAIVAGGALLFWSFFAGFRRVRTAKHGGPDRPVASGTTTS